MNRQKIYQFNGEFLKILWIVNTLYILLKALMQVCTAQVGVLRDDMSPSAVCKLTPMCGKQVLA